MSEILPRQRRSRVVIEARPRLIAGIIREIDQRRLTAKTLSEIYPIARQHLYDLRSENVGRAESWFGIDKLLSLAEALELDIQALLFPATVDDVRAAA